jgi:amino acid transporter
MQPQRSSSESAIPTIGRFVVPATVMLSFVSFWRAAAIVLSDLGSSAYYVGGIAENKIGKAAPWFVLGIMLFSYAVRAVYIESCSMFTRGGVYRVVREAMGATAAKFSVSALMFDYVLTGPISAVSAGLYLASLLDQLADQFGLPHLPLSPHLVAAVFAVIVICYFWWTNTVGIPFSSTRALRVMQITTVMVVLLVGWCLLTIAVKGFQSVPAPTPANLHFSDDALGWLKGTHIPDVAVIAILIGLGHSLFAMSGEESLAQVYREVEAPKRKNLLRVGLIIFGYSLVFTALVSFFAVMLIPDDQRQQVQDNLISGIAMVLVGPQWLRLGFQAFVVVVGVLILSAAVNTSIIGSNGVLNRVAEDGVLSDWFREPQKRYGTTYRIIAMISILQIATVIISRGDVTLLGEAYAFGVAWSFAMKALAVTVLRFTRPDADRWRVPLNLRLGKRELPIGLMLITTLLFLLAGVNLLTKESATIGGVAFTILFFILLTISERRNAGKKGAGRISERFRLEFRDDLSPKELGVRPGGIVVGVHDPEQLGHLNGVLEHSDPGKQDVILVAVKPGDPAHFQQADEPDQVVGEWEVRVFTTAVAAAEDAGKPVVLVGLVGDRPYGTVLQAARALQSTNVVVGVSEQGVEAQTEKIQSDWQHMAAQAGDVHVEIVPDKGAPTCIDLESADAAPG